MSSNKLEFPEGFFEKPRREATKEPLAVISEPMQVSEEVLRGEKTATADIRQTGD